MYIPVIFMNNVTYHFAYGTKQKQWSVQPFAHNRHTHTRSRSFEKTELETVSNSQNINHIHINIKENFAVFISYFSIFIFVLNGKKGGKRIPKRRCTCVWNEKTLEKYFLFLATERDSSNWNGRCVWEEERWLKYSYYTIFIWFLPFTYFLIYHHLFRALICVDKYQDQTVCVPFRKRKKSSKNFEFT